MQGETARAAPDANGTETSVVRHLAEKLQDAIQQIVVGQKRIIDLATVALLARGHVLIEGVPGTGKTTISKALAAALRCDFARIQFTPDLVPADVLGVNLFDLAKREFEFRPGPVFTQILLADEINRATPRTQSALLEAMQEGQATIDGVTTELPSPFLVLATLNPVEMEGTFPLPEAQLDRFLLCLDMDYPDAADEAAMLDRFQSGAAAPEIRPVAGPQEILQARNIVDSVFVNETVRDYLLSIVQATRQEEQVRLGASPRAALALQRASQAYAAMDGRAFTLPDDIKSLAVPVLAHRLILESGARLRGMTSVRLIEEILDRVPVPIES